jgi:hypothetical protein
VVPSGLTITRSGCLWRGPVDIGVGLAEYLADGREPCGCCFSVGDCQFEVREDPFGRRAELDQGSDSRPGARHKAVTLGDRLCCRECHGFMVAVGYDMSREMGDFGCWSHCGYFVHSC